MSSNAESEIEIELDGDWRKYAAPMAGFKMLGVLRQARRVQGALAFNARAGAYVVVNGAAIELLNRQNVANAIALAQHKKKAS